MKKLVTSCVSMQYGCNSDLKAPQAWLILLLCLLVCGARANGNAQADALLSKMTLDEKIGQMVQVDSGALKNPADVSKYFIGSVLSGGDSDPANNLPGTWLKQAR